jgi:hypothetical protein
MEPESTKTWNPGRVEDFDPINNLLDINIPSHTFSLLATTMVLDIDIVEDDNMEAAESLQKELDSCATMPVVGLCLCHIGYGMNSRCKLHLCQTISPCRYCTNRGCPISI